MQRRKQIPTKPRFEYVRNQAAKLLVELGISSFPVSPWDIIQENEDKMVCLPLSEANAVLKKEGLNSLFRNKKDEGVTLKQRGDSFYTILYNDLDIDNPDRIKWTVMHELGHVFLNHLNEFEKTAIHRGGLTEGEYGVLEIEAHMFAAEMFAPTPVMLLYNGISERLFRQRWF